MIFDPKRLQELQDLGGEEFVSELWATFLEICADQVPVLEQALMAENASIASQVSHALRSASGNVGANALHSVCTQIEDDVRNKQAQFADLAALLISTYEETLACEPARKSA